MACRGDLGSIVTNTWSFGAVDCHFNVPGLFLMTISGIHDPNLRLEVSGGRSEHQTWAEGNAVITAGIILG